MSYLFRLQNEKQTLELCLEAVKEDGLLLPYVENKTPEIMMEAVKQNGLAIAFIYNLIPPNRSELVKEALRSNPYSINYIDPSITTLQEATWDNPSLFRWYLEKINKAYINDNIIEFICKLIKKDTTCVKYLLQLEKFSCDRTQFYELAIERNPKVIEFFPKDTNYIYYTAFNPRIIKYTGSYVFPLHVIEKILRRDGLLLKYVENPSEKLCKIALTQKGIAIRYIENPCKEYRRIAINQNYKSIRYISNCDEDDLIRAYNISSDTLNYLNNANYIFILEKAIPDSTRNFNKYFEITIDQIKKNGLLLKLAKVKEVNLQVEAVKQTGLALQYIDFNTLPYLATIEVVYIGLNSNPELYSYVPESTIEFFLNDTLCDSSEMAKKMFDKEYRELVIKKVLGYDGLLIRHIDNPCEEYIKIALEQNPRALEHIDKVSYYLIRDALKVDGYCLKYCKKYFSRLNIEDYFNAVSNCKEAIQFVPKEIADNNPTIYRIALEL